jgi:hypothetical protein
VEPKDGDIRRASLDRLFEVYRVRKKRRILKRALRLWRQAEHERHLVSLEEAEALIH